MVILSGHVKANTKKGCFLIGLKPAVASASVWLWVEMAKPERNYLKDENGTAFLVSLGRLWQYLESFRRKNWTVHRTDRWDTFICYLTNNLQQNFTENGETTQKSCGESWLKVDGGKDGLPELSTNHQTPHRLQHWLMKYLSRQSHITCFPVLLTPP